MLTILSIALVLIVLAYGWCFYTLGSIANQTVFDGFYRLPLAERKKMRSGIQRKARWISLLAKPLTWLGMKMPIVNFEGTLVPGVCTEEAMAFARDYKPEPCDVFVATQMKCGTTWMQQIVYQLLTKGAGEYSDDGIPHLYAMSPWIESEGAVRHADAPLVEGRRIIKTHLGTNLCPYSESAKYIYVVRHPAACLASSIDFVSMLMGPMAFSRDEFLDWFCSDEMWWGTWADHAEGWWRWSQERDNVLFIHYEQLLENPREEMQRIADFLGVTLDEQEMANAIEKSSYRYMKEHDYYFEMTPPTPFDTGDTGYFVKGSKDRGKDITEAENTRVIEFCRQRLDGASYPYATYYPDMAG